MTKRYVEFNRTKCCIQCGDMFNSSRYNADFCSARCRKRRQRELERIDAHLAAALFILDDLKAHKGHVGEEKAFQAVQKIAARAVGLRDYWE
jgi:hypothetical protein